MKKKNGFRTASLDRIDSSKGYVEGNVQWVHKRVNHLKYNFQENYFITLCRNVSDWNDFSNYGSKERHLLMNNIPELCDKYHHSCNGYKYITGTVFNVITSVEKQFLIGIEYINDLIEEQQFKCALSGKPLYLPKTTKESIAGMRTASLDRIDNSKGYIYGNVHWVHKDVNHSRWGLSIEEYILWCYRISQNIKCVPLD